MRRKMKFFDVPFWIVAFAIISSFLFGYWGAETKAEAMLSQNSLLTIWVLVFVLKMDYYGVSNRHDPTDVPTDVSE